MPSTITLTVLLLSCGLMASGAPPTKEGGGPVDRLLLEQLVALERAALDRWIRLDPQGYLDLQAPEVTYFDPFSPRRIDGLDAIQARVAPMKDMKPTFTDPRYDMIDPKVQRHGDVAVLTFNLVNHGKPPGGAERVLARWNSTEVYRLIGGKWKIIHSHWSFTEPELKQPGPL